MILIIGFSILLNVKHTFLNSTEQNILVNELELVFLQK